MVSGKNLFTMCDMDQSFKLGIVYNGLEYVVIVDANSKHYFSGKKLDNLKMEDHTVAHTLINIVIKEAFRQTNLRQIGKTPRFFDETRKKQTPLENMEIMPGFRASAFTYEAGLTLVLENVYKFLCTSSCLSRIYEIFHQNKKDPELQVIKEFKGQSVIGKWGNNKAYIVDDILFKESPVNKYFENSEGQKTSISEYFLKAYGLAVSDRNQPLFLVKIAGKECHLPPEFCFVDGVPQAVRQDNMAMKGLLETCRKTPKEKMAEINSFTNTLFSQKALKEWGIKISADPYRMEATILPIPQLALASGKRQNCDENTLRKLSIQHPVDLPKGSWIMCYDASRQYQVADGLYQMMLQASGRLGMNVGEPTWFELQHEYDYQGFEGMLKNYLDHCGIPTVCMIVLFSDKQYQAFKNICYRYNVISQVVLVKTAKKNNISVASNILRQLNSKLGGDLYTMAFPNDIHQHTMLVGIDVCHHGGKSIVGFCASINQ